MPRLTAATVAIVVPLVVWALILVFARDSVGAWIGQGVRFSEGWSYFWSAAILAAATVALHLVTLSVAPATSNATPRRGLFFLVVGEDGRVSTSKLQVILWTFAVAFAFLAVILQGRLSVLTGQPLEAQYLLLLGIPVAGAIGAKLITTTKVKNQTLDKPEVEDPEAVAGVDPTPQDPPNPLQGLAEAVSDDQGRGDIGDFQYLLFNLVALAFFFVALFTSDTGTLPKIPDTLVALTGASALAYLTKKGVVDDEPIISGVYPSRGSRGEVVHIRGHHFLGASSASGVTTDRSGRRRMRVTRSDPSRGVQVMIGGVLAEDVRCSSSSVVRAVVPDAPVDVLELTVLTAGGLLTNAVTFEVVAPTPPKLVRVLPIVLRASEPFKVFGTGFKHGTEPPSVDIDGVSCPVVNFTSNGIEAKLPEDISRLRVGVAKIVATGGIGHPSDPLDVDLVSA